jgi:hypothetical protein
MRNKRRVLFAVCLIVIFSVFAVHAGTERGEPQGVITISGAWALYPIAVTWAEEFQKLYPRVKIDISAGGAGKGMADCLAKVVDIAMVSRDVYPEEISKGAWALSVAKDAVVPTINANNPAMKELLARGVTREALQGMIPFMGFVGVHISTIKEKIPRTVFMIIFLLLSSAFVFSWFQIADKPIEPTGEAVSVLETMRHQKDLVVIFPQRIEGLIGHYAQLPSSSVLGVQPTDDAASVEEKIEPMLKMQRFGFNTGPHSVFLLMRSSPLFKRRPEVYLWLIEYLKQRFGDPVFFRQFGCFSITQFKE